MSVKVLDYPFYMVHANEGGSCERPAFYLTSNKKEDLNREVERTRSFIRLLDGAAIPKESQPIVCGSCGNLIKSQGRFNDIRNNNLSFFVRWLYVNKKHLT